MAVEIISSGQTTKYSKVFKVEAGYAVVLSSFNFRCAETDKVGNVTKSADCAILHKVELGVDPLPQGKDCEACNRCVFENLSTSIVSSEPVVQCGELWTHNAENNISVLSVPGFYMFELCDEGAIGTVSMTLEEVNAAQAALLPKPLFHGEC